MAELGSKYTSIRFTEDQRLLMLEHVQRTEPEEACGLLGGRGNRVHAVVPITNMLRSSDRYRMEPVEQLRAFMSFESHGLEILGIYHSHPCGPVYPSKTDVDESTYPDVVSMIWSKDSNIWECRAFSIEDETYREVEIQIAHD